MQGHQVLKFEQLLLFSRHPVVRVPIKLRKVFLFVGLTPFLLLDLLVFLDQLLDEFLFLLCFGFRVEGRLVRATFGAVLAPARLADDADEVVTTSCCTSGRQLCRRLTLSRAFSPTQFFSSAPLCVPTLSAYRRPF